MLPRFPLHSQGMVLKILPIPFSLPLRDYHPVSCSVPGDFKSRKRQVRKSSTLHFHHITITDSVWTAPLSLAVTHGISLIFFPAGTKTLQFPAFPGHDWPTLRSLIQIAPVQHLRAVRRSISLLVTSFIGVLSQVIHLAVFLRCANLIWLITMIADDSWRVSS